MSLLEQQLQPKQKEDDSANSYRTKYQALRSALEQIESEIRQDEAVTTLYLSARARDPIVAQYYERLRARIEAAGTANFPSINGKPVYGSGAVLLYMNTEGRVTSVEVVESTGEAVRTHIESLLRSLSPFEPMPSEVARRPERVLLVTAFNYTRR